MPIYYLKFKIIPTINNDHFDIVSGAFASCWVECEDPFSAINISKFHVIKSEWVIEEIGTQPIICTIEDFNDRDIGKIYFTKAEEEGLSICYTAWARDGKTSKSLEVTTKKINICEYLSLQKKFSKKGRCLHYGSSGQCNEFINAHSIQRNQSLSEIASKGEVYMVSTSYSDIKRNFGKQTFSKIGVNKASTFLGFCKKHDNELFDPIDNLPLIPTDHQVMLYAYRSLCREIFVKSNSVSIYENQSKGKTLPLATRSLFDSAAKGAKFGLTNLLRQKKYFDNSLICKTYHDIEYVIFNINQKPVIAFSGLIFPDYDFLGHKLQDLSNHNNNLELITFFSAPTSEGWAYTFAWHKNNESVCEQYIRSLASIVYDGQALGNAIFRLAIQCCENLAISPDWFESIPIDKINTICKILTDYYNPLTIIKPNYLNKGFENIVDWKIDTVETTMD